MTHVPRRPRAARPFLFAVAALAILVSALVALIPALDVVRGAALVVRAAGMHGPWPDRLVAWTARPFTSRELRVPSRQGPLRARLYVPAGPTRRTVILTAGVHAEGIDEPRLVKLARDFAEIGVTVLTPELPDLLGYRITPGLADSIEDSVAWSSRDPALAPDGRVGVVGISFSGGLSIVAAGRESVRDRIAYTVSFGGHASLGRTLRYLCTGLQPDGSLRRPHDYGVVIILLNAAHVMVPADQAEPLRHGIRMFLRASHIDMVDHARARVVFDEAIAYQATLQEPAATLMRYVNTRDVARLGPLLLKEIEKVTTDPALSAERSPAPTAPVYLIHGTDDNVIPAVESRLLAESLRARGTPVRLLLTPLITHAEVDREPSFADIRDLLTFWGDILAR